jgi:hypothetical protein
MAQDLFDRFFGQQKPFAKSAMPKESLLDFLAWAAENEVNPNDPSFDAEGAFLAGDKRDELGHLGSIGLGGKILKSPDHPTAYKTAAAEMLRLVAPERVEAVVGLPRKEAHALLLKILQSAEGAGG